ncbi:hypothetical protein SAMN04487947_1206 [Halogeometricum rufum]|uniref:Uncharacterized protein n=1 Tax=Halogeometricum rufum TaxID=553469 RepID=A0A1I6GIK7_9EURY|nr:hypothetical protein SAMN04487947_1206 [Halogeometricum rufum]
MVQKGPIGSRLIAHLILLITVGIIAVFVVQFFSVALQQSYISKGEPFYYLTRQFMLERVENLQLFVVACVGISSFITESLHKFEKQGR